MTRIVSAIAFGLLIGPAPLYAMPVSYGISTSNTAIGLSWQAFGGTSQAHLVGVTGEFTLDMANDMDDRLSVNIPVATLTASNSLLTWQMKGRLFFDADRYPAIRFTSSRVAALVGDTVTIDIAIEAKVRHRA